MQTVFRTNPDHSTRPLCQHENRLRSNFNFMQAFRSQYTFTRPYTPEAIVCAHEKHTILSRQQGERPTSFEQIIVRHSERGNIALTTNHA